MVYYFTSYIEKNQELENLKVFMDCNSTRIWNSDGRKKPKQPFKNEII